jgi:hypothetical protein
MAETKRKPKGNQMETKPPKRKPKGNQKETKWKQNPRTGPSGNQKETKRKPKGNHIWPGKLRNIEVEKSCFHPVGWVLARPNLVSFWFPFGFLVVSAWAGSGVLFPFGFLLVSFWFPPGFVFFHLVSFWFHFGFRHFGHGGIVA